jgi:hypothetical protein
VVKILQVINALDVLDLVVAQIQAAKFCEGVKAFDMGDQVIIEFEVLEGSGKGIGKIDGADGVLAQTQFLSWRQSAVLVLDVA